MSSPRKKKRAPKQNDAAIIQFELLRLDDLGTQDLALSNLRKLADDFKGKNMNAWLSSIAKVRPQLERGSARAGLLHIMTYLVENFYLKLTGRASVVVNVMLDFIEDKESVVTSALSKAIRTCAVLVIPNIDTTSSGTLDSTKKISKSQDDASPFVKLILRPLMSRLTQRAPIYERVNAASVLKEISNPADGVKEYRDLLEDNLSQISRLLSKTLWEERSRAGAALCACVGNLAVHLSPQSLSPFRTRLSETILYRLSDKDCPWQTVEEAVRALGHLISTHPNPDSKWLRRFLSCVEELKTSHKTHKVRAASKKTFDVINSKLASLREVEIDGEDGKEESSQGIASTNRANERLANTRLTTPPSDNEKEGNTNASENESELSSKLPSKTEIGKKLGLLRSLRSEVRENMRENERKRDMDVAVGKGFNAVTKLNSLARVEDDSVPVDPRHAPTPRRRDGSLLLNSQQLTQRATFTTMEDLMVRQEQMWSELISLQRLVYDPPWLSSVESRIEKLESQMERAILRIDAVERRQRDLSKASVQHARLATWTAKTAVAVAQTQSTDVAVRARNVNDELSHRVLKLMRGGSTKDIVKALRRQKPTRLRALSIEALRALLEKCATILESNQHVDVALPWVEQAIKLQLLPPVLHVPLRERIVKSLYRLSASPSNDGVVAAGLYQLASSVGWVP